MGKEDKEFEKARESVEEGIKNICDGLKSVSDALRERSRGRMLMRPDVVLACEDLGIDFVSWFVHFGIVSPFHATCEMCEDYLTGICENPCGNPVECFTKYKHRFITLRNKDSLMRKNSGRKLGRY